MFSNDEANDGGIEKKIIINRPDDSRAPTTLRESSGPSSETF
jgi:hypothetical protein